MKRDHVLQLLTANRAQLENYGVRSLAVFGSTMRNEARADSDVDLLVDFEAPATFDRYVELSFYLKNLLDRPVDLVTRRSLHPALHASVERDACYVAGLSPVSG